MMYTAREQIIAEIQEMGGIVGSLQPVACEQPYGGMSMAAHCDGAVTAISQIPLLKTEQEGLNRLITTLQRFDAGTYGKCRGCGNDISEARLNAIPTAELCISCKKKEEAPQNSD